MKSRDQKRENRKATQRKIQRYARMLKARPTKAERLVRDELTQRGIRHRFQAYFHDSERGFIVDFLFRRCGMNPLVVEIDGESHRSARARVYDEKRTEWLNRNRNIKVIRFTNESVFTDASGVVDEIVSLFPIERQKRTREKPKVVQRGSKDERRFIAHWLRVGRLKSTPLVRSQLRREFQRRAGDKGEVRTPEWG